MAKKFICLQAGHENQRNNCVVALRGGTGAPGEVEMTVRVRNRLKDVLLSKKNIDGTDAFAIQLVDGTFNCDPTAGKTNFDFFLAIHGEADVHNMDGGMISAPHPSVDYSSAESNRIVAAIASEYFNHAGITNRPNWISNNMLYYYMWSALTAKTPCGLIEVGVVQNAHDKVILADTDRVANAIARGICKAFNVPFDVIPPVPPSVITDSTRIPQIGNKTVSEIKEQMESDQRNLKDTSMKVNTLSDKIKKGVEVLLA